jgi:AAA domain, putative AbiEii toxin, Type IV TA system
MRLLRRITIEGFRSIQSGVIDDLGGLTALAGLNNSGKSNVLRALNAFFTGETDPGRALDVDSDYFRPDLRKKKAKEIRVGVRFELPDAFKFRNDLALVESLLGGREFEIEKRWRRKSPQPAYFVQGSELSADERQRIDQFLQLISYRYIPNRVLPLDVIRSEQRALRDVLIRRLGKRGVGHEAAFDAIRETSEALIKKLAERFMSVYPDAAALRLAVPTSWSDLVFAFGYVLQQGDVELEDAVQGSGIQSLLMFETLYLIDLDYFQRFGWRQASIWAVEEPESSLHSSLEARIASFLSTIASDPSGRLQVLTTTHSDLVLQYSDKAILVQHGAAGGSAFTTGPVREVLDKTARAGVSRWVDPVLFNPLQPLLLVEGKSDRATIEEAFRILRPSVAIRVADLEELQQTSGRGGVETIIKYARDRAAAIRTRDQSAPVIVLLDWDASQRVSAVSQPFDAADPFKALAWEEPGANPELGSGFHGIERFYPTSLIEKAADEESIALARTETGEVVVTSDIYRRLKSALAAIVARDGLSPEDLEFIQPQLAQVLAPVQPQILPTETGGS